MTDRLRPYLFLAAILPSVGSSAQWDLFFDGSIPVQRQNIQLDLAWSGGINYGQVGLVDLDQDGLKDVVIFDRFSNTLQTLLNTGEPGLMGYRVSRAFDVIYPFNRLHDWVLFRDYNCDGKEDIFSYSNAGFSVHKNTSTANAPSFELVSQQVRSNYVSPSGAGSIANLFISQVDLPGIVDVDGDGDLDVLTFQLLGSYLEYHRNLSMELYGNCDSLKFEIRNKCWGYFAENFSNNSVTLNVPCSFNVPAPEIDGGGEAMRLNEVGAATNKTQAHAGSSVTPLDLDGDGDMDLLLGDISYNNLVALYNGGTASSAIMTAKDSIFPVDNVPVDLPIFPAGFHLDIDKDGSKDLLVCPNATSLAHDYESLWYYRNNGTDLAPQFELEQRNLFQDRSIELGEGAYPVPFDQNGDGLMDLLVANHGYYASGGLYVGKIALLINIGTASQPAFDLVTDDYLGLSTSGIGASMYPAFSDVDGDGDKDMYVGDLQGRMHFFRNTATGPVAQFQLEQANITDNTGIPQLRHGRL
ncbi:MAG: VCBS repeat-containing protein [Flavobacteriales bacterium]|nr:VCBS repeat-containing protein [Flavobacteriales bacterium]